MEKTKRKLIDISLACGLIAAIFFSMLGFTDACKELYDNIIRIRIIVNSDSDADQALKLQIRDAVLEDSKTVFSDVDGYESAVIRASENLDRFRDIAECVVRENGFDYDVALSVRDEYFDTRVYDDFTLPAGTYTSLVFTVGEGKGHNWWCVVYPEVCVGACSGELTDSVSEASADFAYRADEYVVKFKIVELFESVKKFITKK